MLPLDEESDQEWAKQNMEERQAQKKRKPRKPIYNLVDDK